MQRWDPKPEWQGEDAYVIGGGDSLRHFDWGLIRGANTVGCNSAFLLGASICKIVLFLDPDWWTEIGKKGTEQYGGRVVGCTPQLINDNCPWLLSIPRNRAGCQEFAHDSLCNGGNTGAAAINLALILGARRVFLLGFDMKLSAEGEANWHDLRHEKARPEVYGRFLREFHKLGPTLAKSFPGREVINITDDSDLNVFPKVPLAEHFGKVAA